MKLLQALCLFAYLSFSAAPIHAQTALGTLTGTITDQAGALLAGARIAALQLDTGTVVRGESSATGNYNLSQLPLGRYDLTVEHMGFKTYKRQGITVVAAEVLRIDATMDVGVMTEIVTVNADASLLRTDSSSLTYNLTVSQIQNLPATPVTSLIRDPFSIANMLPGVRYVINATMAINGLPTDQVQYRIDGQVLGNIRLGSSSATTQVQPSVDAIQEMAVQTSNYAAEFGSVGGALFNLTMKSGTNQFHGSGYDYAVNEILNAAGSGTHVRDTVRRHDWGVTLGGPIRVPKVYDGGGKSFFFFGWERYDQSLRSAVTQTVPTQAYRDGDFSALTSLAGNRNLTIGTGLPCTIPAQLNCRRDYRDPAGGTILSGTLFDPNSTTVVTCNTALSSDCGPNGSLLSYRTPLPGNRVPTSLFDPVSLAIQSKYIPFPLGKNSGEVSDNYAGTSSFPKLIVIPSLKLDHNLSSSSRLSFYYHLTRNRSFTQGQVDGFNDPITTTLGTYQSQQRYTLNFDQAITPQMQLHLGSGWTQFEWDTRASVINFDPATDIGLRGIRLARSFPHFDATTAYGWGGMGAMGPGAAQGKSPERRPSGVVSLTWLKNSHSIKIGADWRMDMLPTSNFGNTNGNFLPTMTGISYQPSLAPLGLQANVTGSTGFPFAEWLMGSVARFMMGTPASFRATKQQWGLFLQDTWRVTRKLTLDYGLRWDYGTYPKEDYGRIAALGLQEPNPSAAGRPGAAIYEATCNCSFAKNYPYAVGPRLGVAYSYNRKTVIRAGFGVSYASTGTFPLGAMASASTPNPEPGRDWFKLRDGIPSSINPVWPTFEAAPNQAPGSVSLASPLPLDSNAGRPARTYQWNVSLQRELARDLVVEAAYVANRGVWQPAPGLVDYNAISVDRLAHYGFEVGNANDGSLLNTSLGTLNSMQQGILRSRGVAIPYPGYSSGQSVLQSIRPFPQYAGAMSPFLAPLGKSWYDALQVVVNKRFSHGLTMNVNYTWSKNLSFTTAPDIFNRDVGKNLAANNVPNQLRVSFEYQIPKFASQTPFFGNKWVNHVVSGWGLAAVVRYQSAAYIGRPASAGAAPVVRWLGRGPGGAQLKKNADGSYMSPWSVDWTDYTGKHRTDPLDINCHCFDPEKTLIFNPAAWESVPDGQWAADTSQLSFFRQQRVPSEAANFSRNFRFGRDSRFSLQIRVEFQNVGNRMVLPPPQMILPGSAQPFTFAQTPTKSGDGRYIAGYGTFGNIRTNPGNPRSGMLVGRLQF